MEEISTITEMPQVNELSKKLRTLQKREMALNQQQTQLNTQKIMSQIGDLQRKNNIMANQIATDCEMISKLMDKPENIICKKEDYIPLPLKHHNDLKVYTKASEIIKTISAEQNTNTAVNVDLSTSLENNHKLTTSIQRVKESFKKCSLLVPAVNNLNNERKSVLEIYDVHMPRQRRSFLSDSGLMNTFDANDISTSSKC